MVVTHNIFANLLVSTITTICQYGEYEPNKKAIAFSYNDSHDDTFAMIRLYRVVLTSNKRAAANNTR